MYKFLTIAKWEYIEKIKNKTYIFTTFILPLVAIGLVVGSTMITSQEDTETKVIGLIEKNISIHTELEKSLFEYKTKDGQPAFLIKKINIPELDKADLIDTTSKLVFDKFLDGFIYIEKVSPDSFIVEYHSEKVTAYKDIIRLEKNLNMILMAEKSKTYNINPEITKKIFKTISLKTIKVTPEGKEKLDLEKVLVGSYFFVLFLIMSLMMSAGSLVRSVVEEKSNRIIEILLSSCSTKDLMAGKVIGLSALGLTQVFVWILIIISIGGPVILSYIQIKDVGFLILYFSLGYIFYSSLFIGVGSIGNTEQETQTIMSVLTIIIFIPLFFSAQIIENPASKIAVYLSYFPLTTVPMMTMRVSIFEVSLIEKITTLLILVISIYFTIWFSGRIFRVAILSYGKTPNIQEIIKWLKSK